MNYKNFFSCSWSKASPYQWGPQLLMLCLLWFFSLPMLHAQTACNNAGDVGLYEEAVDGELPSAPNGPQVIAMPLPFNESVTYVVNGSLAAGNRDAITFTVPEGSELSFLNINAFTGCATIDLVRLWEGVGNGGTMLFNEFNYAGGNLGPLTPGVYTLRLAQDLCSITCYRIAFRFSCDAPAISINSFGGNPFNEVCVGDEARFLASPPAAAPPGVASYDWTFSGSPTVTQ